jgi:PAS domain S-box-containing protein
MKTENVFERFFELSSDLMCVAGIDGYFKKLNSSWERALGWSRQELLAESIGTFIHPDDIEATFKEVEKQISGETTAAFVNRYRHKDGSYRWLEWVATPAMDGNLYACARDITERKLTEAALQESGARLQAILDNSSTLISMKDKEGNVLLTNKQFDVLDGPPPEAYIGKNVYDLFPKEIADDLWMNDLAAMNSNAPIEAEEVVKHSNGEFHTYLTTKFPVRIGDAEPFGTCAISTDITERKQAEMSLLESEEKFRSIYLSANVAMIISIDKIGSIISWNPGAEKAFGYAEKEILDQPLTRLMPERYRAAHTAGLKRACESGEYHIVGKTIELEGLHKDGHEFPLELSLGAWRSKGEIYFSAVIHDISERKLAEEKLQAALVDAERANQAKSEFLATMSHEFRTPLNAILGFSEMLRSQYFGPLGADNYQIYANDIHTSGEHMMELVNDMLDIAAIEAGKRPMVNETVDVSKVVEDCVRNVEPAAKDSGINLSLDIPGGSPSIYADRRSITQITFNLLSNAIKFTEWDGTISVSVKANKKMILITVSDTGVGIPPEKLSTVTDPFSQTHTDPLITQKGTGLGLTIVKSLVEAHAGKLNIESEVGKGTTVTVTLPSQRMGD